MPGFDFEKNKKHSHWQGEFLTNCRHLNRSEHTLKNYNADLEKFFIWYECHYPKTINHVGSRVITQYQQFLTTGGKFPLKKLRPKWHKIFSWLGRFKNQKFSGVYMEQRPLSVNSQKRHLSTLKNFFEFLKQTHEEQKKIFIFNPVKSKIHQVKVKEADIEHTHMLYPEQWKALDETSFSAEDRLMLQLMYYGGLRLHEVAQLKIWDLDFETQTLKFKRKGGKVHHLKPFIKSEIFYLAKILINKHPTHQYLFAHKIDAPIPLSTMHTKIKRIFKAAGLPHKLTAHSLRKACATQLYLRTKDLLLVRDYLGHSDAKVTQTYIDQKSLHRMALL